MHQRIVFRFMLPTIVVAVGLVLLGGCAGWYIHRLQQSSAQSLSENVAKVTAAEELVIISHELRHELSQYLATNDPSHVQAAAKLKLSADHWITQCERLTATPAEAVVVSDIKRGYARFYATFSRLNSASSQDEFRGIVTELIAGVVTADILTPVVNYRKMIGSTMADATRRDQLLADRMGLGLLVLGACGAVGGLVAGYGFARSLHHSMLKLSVPVRDAAGMLDEVVGPIEIAADDVSDLEATMQTVADRVGTVIENMRNSQTIARRSEQLASLGQLAAGIAHELRNPLTSMKIIIQTALDENDPTELDDRDLSILGEEVARLETTIQSFLDYARPPRLVKRPTMVLREIERTLDLVAHRAHQMGITIRQEIPDDKITAHADPAQLRQVILNLLINALEVSPQGAQVTVRVTSRSETSPLVATDSDGASRPWLQLDVEDRGPGLPAELRERIFEPFFTTKDSGTGLGLAITKRIVDDHGGQIAAEPREGGGTRFSVRLPIGRPEDVATAAAQSTPDGETFGRPPQGPGNDK